MNCVSTYQSDWINSRPIYYNVRTKTVGFEMYDVIDWNNFEFDNEGLYNYLVFGYQVFEQTPVKDVKLLRHSSELKQYIDEKGEWKLQIVELPDPIDAYVGVRTSEEDALSCLESHVSNFEKEATQQHPNKRFLLPLSGGYDSRLLAFLIRDRSRIDAVTYDISLSERYSFEVIQAREVCKRLHIHWNQVFLDQYWNADYVWKNFQTFCLEMPIHASYHFELYEKIKQTKGKEYIVLSGSVGDWWSGEKVPLGVPKDHLNFDSLFFNHGISIPPEFIEITTDHAMKREYFEKNIRRLTEDNVYKIVFARRGRINLASYIYRTAAHYFDTYTPFYDLNVAMSQLHLPLDKRVNRKWLQDFFRKNNLDIEHDFRKKPMSKDNVLDVKTMYYTLTSHDLLTPEYFKGIVNTRRVQWINEMMMKIKFIPFPLLTALSRVSYGIDTVMNAIALRTIFGKGFDYTYCRVFKTREIAKAISEWSVLKPIELAQQKAGIKI